MSLRWPELWVVTPSAIKYSSVIIRLLAVGWILSVGVCVCVCVCVLRPHPEIARSSVESVIKSRALPCAEKKLVCSQLATVARL